MTLRGAGAVIGVAFFVALSMWPVKAEVHYDDGRHPDVVTCDAPIIQIINRDAMGVRGTDSTSAIRTRLACAKRAQVTLAIGVIGATVLLLAWLLWQSRRERDSTNRRHPGSQDPSVSAPRSI